MTSETTTYPDVVHRKAGGSLVLDCGGLSFRPDGENDGGGTGTGASSSSSSSSSRVVLPWNRVAKHQVSPATHPKSLLKIVSSSSSHGVGGGSDNGGKIKSFTFLFPDRESLEGARRDVTARISMSKADGNQKGGDKKRPRSTSMEPAAHRASTPPSSRFVNFDPVALVATRSSILASDPALRAQHRLLVLDGGTLSEEDFWETHARLVANEYAKISGRTNRGMSSDIKSSLDLGISTSSKKGGGGAKKASGGIVHLGVEEMRQIFIMYPAVHRAYEEKVPLELSEEQFWRKYLESEFFHRDRGRIGAHIGKVNERELIEQERVLGKRGGGMDGGGMGADGEKKKKKDDKKKEDETMGEEEAKSRLAAAGTDDIFSRYDPRGGRGGGGHKSGGAHHRHRNHHGPAARRLGTKIAVGQFDLASTNEVERGGRFLELKDLHPPPERDSAGARVIDKYNRHWAIVLHPTESTAGKELGGVAARSAREAAASGGDGEDAKVNGGYDREMRRLIGFADADDVDADFARGCGDADDLLELHLHNVGAYSGKFGSHPSKVGGGGTAGSEKHLQYAKYLAAAMRADTEPILRGRNAGRAKGFCDAPTLKKPLPDPRIGRGLLEALSKKMAADSQTEEDVQKLADELPEEFKTKLATFFRRASELLRHFFSLRSVFNGDADGNGGVGQSESQKNRLTNIVKGMEKVHGEMYELTRDLPQMESKMFKPIMDQLDWAFKLHREDGSKSKGGFVTVAKGGFVQVAH